MRVLLAVVLATGFVALAYAQARTIPGDAKRGEMRHLQGMEVEIDGNRVRLAPGAQIRDAHNRVVVPVSLSGKLDVKYLLDGQGMVRRVWILTPEEAKQ
jgi:hypothetical protein